MKNTKGSAPRLWQFALALTIIGATLIASAQTAAFKVVHQFTGIDGQNPLAPLIFDAAGNFYGETHSGGANNAGVVFEFSPISGGQWNETILHDFSGGADGFAPEGGLVFDAAGNLYGVTGGGGSTSPGCADFGGCGTVFRLSPTSSGGWNFSTLYTFNAGAGGLAPNSPPIPDSAGNLYGTTPLGGDSFRCNTEGCGVIFKLAPTPTGEWTENVLYTFSDLGDGGSPSGGVIFDANGNLYGTAAIGGNELHPCPLGCGVVYELAPQSPGAWTYKALHAFEATDGNMPNGSLTFDAAGNLYGTAYYGGVLKECGTGTGCGVAYKLSPDSNGFWSETILNYFKSDPHDPSEGGPGGANPMGQLQFDSNGNLYGTTFSGGLHRQVGFRTPDDGVVFELSPTSAGVWRETVLYEFTGGADGGGPASGVTFDAGGNMFGTTFVGGSTSGNCGFYGCGTVFVITP